MSKWHNGSKGEELALLAYLNKKSIITTTSPMTENKVICCALLTSDEYLDFTVVLESKEEMS